VHVPFKDRWCIYAVLIIEKGNTDNRRTKIDIKIKSKFRAEIRLSTIGKGVRYLKNRIGINKNRE